MSEHNPRPLAELIDPGWAKALAPVEGRIHELGAMLAAEVEEGRGYGCWPSAAITTLPSA